MNKYSNYSEILINKINKWNIAQAIKWSIYFIVIGLIAGMGSIVFTYMCNFGTHFFMTL